MEVMHDRVLLKKIEPEKKTASGFYIATVDESDKATVIKVGNGKLAEDDTRIPLTVKEGDIVIYNPNSTISVTLNREAFLVIKEDEIFAILDNPEQ